MSVVFRNEHGHGFPDVAPVNSRPRFLSLNHAFVRMQNDEGSEVTFRSKTESIAISVDLAGDDVLACCGPNRTNHVSVLSCLFVGFSRRGGLHVLDQFVQEGRSIAVEHPSGDLHPFIVASSIDAGPSTQPNVHGEATLREQFLAVPYSKLAAKQLHHLLGCTGVRKRPPLLTGFWGPSRVKNAGVRLVGQGEVREGFVVFEHRIKSGKVLSDQLALKDQCGLRGLGNDAFDVVCSSNKFRDHVPVWIR